MNLELLGPLLGWPLMLLAAWLAGDWLYQRWQLPRVFTYGVVGLLLGGVGLSKGSAPQGALNFVANVALGLILFELGYRINLRWLRSNPWIVAGGLLQSVLIFAVVMTVAAAFSLPTDQGLVLATLCIVTSPAAVMRITDELRSSGQATERLLHLCAVNCLLAVLLLKLVIGYWHLETRGDLAQALFNSLYVIVLSLLAGAAFGVLAPWLNRVATSGQSTTVTFAILVLLLTGLAQSLQLSALLAALAFGCVARERRVMLSQGQRNFGAYGDLLTVFLFVFVGSLLSWTGLGAGLLIGLVVLPARTAVHVLVNLGVAHLSGTTWRKGALVGVALMPMSAFALLLLEESRLYGFELARDSLPVIAGLLMLLDIVGPLATQRALLWAGEATPPREH